MSSLILSKSRGVGGSTLEPICPDLAKMIENTEKEPRSNQKGKDATEKMTCFSGWLILVLTTFLETLNFRWERGRG